MSLKIRTQQEYQSDTTLLEVVELSQNELQLIKAIRNRWRFGEITILVREGVPYRLKRVEEFLELDKPLEEQT